MSAEFGKYQIQKKLAVGGMAEIYLARHRSVGGFERNVVLKKILPELADDPSFVESFLNEAKLAAQLNHSNIVQIYDLGMVGRSYFIAMEYIKGFDLSTILRAARRTKTPLPLPVALSIARDLLSALDYAHAASDLDGRSLGIVHRDVTPSNILITGEGQAKVVDFGIAKATAKNEGKTRTGTVKGKISYLAPEQVLSKPIDRRVDVFAAGIVIYELLTLENPFRGDNDYVTLRNIVEKTPPAPHELRPEIPQAISAAVQRALTTNREERAASCGEVLALLERAATDAGIVVTSTEVKRYVAEKQAALDAIVERDRLEDELTEGEMSGEIDPAAGPERSATVPPPARKKPRGTVVAAAASIVLIAVGAGGVMLLKRDPPPPPPQATLPPPASAPVVAPVTVEKPIEKAPEPRKPPPERKPKTAAAGPPGKVRFMIRPWGEVEVDGKVIGLTPLPVMELASGAHKIVIRNSELGKSVTKSVTITSGKQSEVRHNFD